MGKANSTTLPRTDVVVMALEQKKKKKKNLIYKQVQGKNLT